MLVSILHRVTGGALTVAGLALLVWWLLAIAEGSAAYASFTQVSSHWAGIAVLIGLTWAFFQHTLSGIRHLVMDSGHGLELQTSKKFSIATILGSLLLTAAVWAFVLGRTA
jgi:succinate dehydrogenase / fumarate reductase cytochrome b subunit